MKRIPLYCLIYIALIVNLPLQAQLISPYNLDFEYNSTSEMPSGWELNKRGAEAGYAAGISNTRVFHGDNSLSIKYQGNANINNTTKAAIYQQIDATFHKNKRVRFSAMCFAENPTSAFEIFISAKAKEDYAYNRNDAVYLKNEWQKISVELEIPDAAETITFGISSEGSTDIYMDFCEFETAGNDTLNYEKPVSLSNIELSYLTAFANAYGHIKYFCPTKQAMEADWNDIALAGIFQAKKMTQNSNIADSLQAFFRAIAPQTVISNNPNENIVQPENETDYKLAWLYTGIPSKINPNYLTKQQVVNLKGSLKEHKGIAVQYIQLQEHQGKEIAVNVKAKLKKFHHGATAGLSIRYENMLGDFIAYETSDTVNLDNWESIDILGKIPDSATRAALILELHGYGEAYFDDVNVLVRDGKYAIPIKVKNSDFEEILSFNNENWMVPQESFADGYDINYSSEEKNEGSHSLIIFTNANATPQLPLPNDIVRADIGQKLHIIYPITINAEFAETKVSDTIKISYETFPKSNGLLYPTGKNENFTLNWQDRASRLAMVINVWNIIKHFSLTNIDNTLLDGLLPLSLKNAATCDNATGFKNILNDMLDITDDVRARAWFESDLSQNYSFPFLLELIDNRLFISNINEKNEKKFIIGDEIIEINGKSIHEYFGNMFTGNNSEWKKIKAVSLFRLGEKNSTATIKYKGANGAIKTEKIVRNTRINDLSVELPNPLQLFENNIVYLDFTILTDKNIGALLDSLKKYDKFIIDLRGELSVSEIFLTLIHNSPFETSRQCVPYFVMPDKKKMSYPYDFNTVYPAKNRLSGDFIFLTNWKTAGRGETFASVVKELQIGKIIGQPTQGSYITSIPIRLDDIFSISLGTMYGYSPSGKALYNSPVVPDISIKTDINYLKNNKDTLIESAINILSK